MSTKYQQQLCQDEYINLEFYKLHRSLVNQVIKFCNDNFLDIDEFCLTADGLKESIKYGEWTPATDSSFVLEKSDDNVPVLWSI